MHQARKRELKTVPNTEKSAFTGKCADYPDYVSNTINNKGEQLWSVYVHVRERESVCACVCQCCVGGVYEHARTYVWLCVCVCA